MKSNNPFSDKLYNHSNTNFGILFSVTLTKSIGISNESTSKQSITSLFNISVNERTEL